MHQAFFRVFDQYASTLDKGCVLMFSTGKDAVCTLDILVSRYNIKPELCYWNVQPFVMDLHKKALEFYSDRYGVPYSIVTHYDRVAEIAANIKARVPTYKEWLLKLYFDQGERPQVFGIKASDNLTAKMLCNKGARLPLHRFYPLVDWKNEHVFRYLEDHNVPITKNYKHGFRDINEFCDAESLAYLEQESPKDYKRLIDIEPWRLAYAE